MLHSAETLILRESGRCVIRSVEPEDAERMLQYMKIMLGETPFLLRTPEEFDYTAEEEARILDGRKNDPRSLMLVAEVDGRLPPVPMCSPMAPRAAGSTARSWESPCGRITGGWESAPR